MPPNSADAASEVTSSGRRWRRRNEENAPFGSHLLYAQDGILDDTNPEERRLGMAAGFAWGGVADLVAVYTDRGISGGMWKGIEVAKGRGTPIEYRKLGDKP